MKILFNFASRSRPQAFFATLNNIREMCATKDYIVVAKLDTDDPSRLQYKARLADYSEVVAEWGISSSKIHAINRDVPQSGWHILINISDDQRFTLKGFDELIRRHCESQPRAFIHFPDSYKKAACCTMSIITLAYWQMCGGNIYNPDYYSLWADMEATEVAKLMDAYVYDSTVIFQHLHYSTTGKEKDALYKRNDTYKRDGQVYHARRKKDFDLNLDTDLPTVLIKYPTRGRWRQFAEAIDNIYSTIRTHKFRIVVSADTDDVEMNSPEVRDICRRYHNVQILYGEPVSKIDACNRDMPGEWHLCILMSDDMRFVEPGWDVKMWDRIRSVWPQGTDFFAHFNDGYVGEKLPTLNICGRQYYDRFDYLYHPSYKSVSCDAENMFVAQMLGRYHYFPEVYFNHMHPANLKEPSDHIYRRNHAYGESDTANYFERLRRLFDVKEPVMIPEQIKPYLNKEAV